MIRAWLEDWGAFGALVLLGWLLPQAVTRAYAAIRTYLDRKHPDDLPFGGGAWIEEQAKERGIDVRVLISGSAADGLDAFIPSSKTIVLGVKSYTKRDPSFWAVAAHEFGHLLFDRRIGALGLVLLGARIVGAAAGAAGAFLVLANVLYAAPPINELAFALLYTSLALYLFVMVDEAAASTIALRLLARDRRIDSRALGGAMITLVAAFFTYVAGFVGQLVLVAQRSVVVTKIAERRHFVPAPHLGTVKLIVAAGLSLLLLYVASRMLLGAARWKKVATPEEAKLAKSFRVVRELVASIVAMVLVILVWDQPFGVVFAVACALAILASRSAIMLATWLARALLGLALYVPVRILVTPLAYLLVFIGNFGRLFRGSDWEAKGAEYGHISLPPPPRPKPEDLLDQTWKKEVEEMSVELHNSMPWHVRAAEVMYAACHVFFVLSFWAGTFGLLH